MEPAKLHQIRLAKNPLQEIKARLIKTDIEAAEAVQTGLLTAEQIHLYVLFCMEQVVAGGVKFDQEKKQNFFNTAPLAYALRIKAAYCDGFRRTEELSDARSRLFVAAKLLTDMGWEIVAEVYEALSGCLSEDPYEAHAFTALPFFAFGSENWLTERRMKMIQILGSGFGRKEKEREIAEASKHVEIDFVKSTAEWQLLPKLERLEKPLHPPFPPHLFPASAASSKAFLSIASEKISKRDVEQTVPKKKLEEEVTKEVETEHKDLFKVLSCKRKKESLW